MDNLLSITSYNSTKTVEELTFNLLTYKIRIKSLINELNFMVFVMNTANYKSQVINLFEMLSVFKNSISDSLSAQKTLLSKIDKTSKTLFQKRECEDLTCDDYFIKDYDFLEEEILEYFNSTTNLKAEAIQYLESVIVQKKQQ